MRTIPLAAGAALLLVGPGVASAQDEASPRLEGPYTAMYQKEAFGEPAVWRLDPRCRVGACNVGVRSDGGLRGVLEYRESTETYRLVDKQDLDGTCEGENGTVERAYVQIRTIKLTGFAGERVNGAVRFARGTVLDLQRPTRRAQDAGCTEPLRKRSVIRLRARG